MTENFSQKKKLAPYLLFLPTIFVIFFDIHLRGRRLLDFSPKYIVSYLLACLQSGSLWGVLLWVSTYKKGFSPWLARFLFVMMSTIALGCQSYFFNQYSTYLNLDATLFGSSISSSILGQLKSDFRVFIQSFWPPLLISVLLLLGAKRWVEPSSKKGWVYSYLLMPFTVISNFFIPCSYRSIQGSTPDIIYFHAIGGLVKSSFDLEPHPIRPGIRTPKTIPQINLSNHRRRNVVFILTESVRSDITCSSFSPSCPTSPDMNELLPNRFGFNQMRANSSTTAIELAVLWSGLNPNESREELHSAPLLFEYAHHFGFDTAYWTSQDLMFANSRLFVRDLPVSHKTSAKELDPLADIDLGGPDEKLSLVVSKEMLELQEPFFAVVHYCNTHAPYRVDDGQSPFQPSSQSKDPSDTPKYKNRYKNAVFLQNKAVSSLIQSIKDSPFADRTILFYTSDHGEAFRDHDQMGHTGAIFDEEVHVPAWVEAPENLISESEKYSLLNNANLPTFHVDVTPTLLDAMGLYNEPDLQEFKKKMHGNSLFLHLPSDRMAILTNCTEIWGCAFKNWGIMQEFIKIEGRQWDKQWNCYNVQSDPFEKNRLTTHECKKLENVANSIFSGPPGIF